MKRLLLPGSGPIAIDTLANAPGDTVLASTTATLSAPNWTATGRFAVVQLQSGGTLDFYCQIANASSSANEPGRITGSEFLSAFTTNLFQTEPVARHFHCRRTSGDEWRSRRARRGGIQLPARRQRDRRNWSR